MVKSILLDETIEDSYMDISNENDDDDFFDESSVDGPEIDYELEKFRFQAEHEIESNTQDQAIWAKCEVKSKGYFGFKKFEYIKERALMLRYAELTSSNHLFNINRNLPLPDTFDSTPNKTNEDYDTINNEILMHSKIDSKINKTSKKSNKKFSLLEFMSEDLEINSDIQTKLKQKKDQYDEILLENNINEKLKKELDVFNYDPYLWTDCMNFCAEDTYKAKKLYVNKRLKILKVVERSKILYAYRDEQFYLQAIEEFKLKKINQKTWNSILKQHNGDEYTSKYDYLFKRAVFLFENEITRRKNELTKIKERFFLTQDLDVLSKLLYVNNLELHEDTNQSKELFDKKNAFAITNEIGTLSFSYDEEGVFKYLFDNIIKIINI